MTSSKEPPAGGEYIQCEKCGAWYTPIFKHQPTCIKCRKDARYKECHGREHEMVVI